MMHKSMEACGDTEMTDHCTWHNGAGTCTKDEGCEASVECYEEGSLPVRPEHAAVCSDHCSCRHNPSQAQQGCMHTLPVISIFDDGMDGWIAAVHVFMPLWSAKVTPVQADAPDVPQ